MPTVVLTQSRSSFAPLASRSLISSILLVNWLSCHERIRANSAITAISISTAMADEAARPIPLRSNHSLTRVNSIASKAARTIGMRKGAAKYSAVADNMAMAALKASCLVLVYMECLMVLFCSLLGFVFLFEVVHIVSIRKINLFSYEANNHEQAYVLNNL